MQDAARARPSAPSTHVFVPIRVHSWFSLFPPLVFFSCISCFSWFKHCLDYAFCIFASIRVHSWFSLFPLLRVFRILRVHSWFNHCLDYVFCIFVSIRVHSWFSLFPPFVYFVFFRGSNTVCAACNESIRGQDEQCLFCGQVMLCLVWDDISGDEAPAFEDFDMINLNPIHEIV